MANKIQKKEENKALKGIKKFFNNPLPLIIFLIITNALLLVYIGNINSKNKIFIGKIDSKEVAVVNVHYFTNSDMNYFYASNAVLLADDSKIYNYQIGYYVVDEKGDYIEFATRSNALEKSTSLKDVVSEMSGWNFAEADRGEYFFSNEVIKNIDNLHFVIKASTKKDSTKADIHYDQKVDATKITK